MSKHNLYGVLGPDDHKRIEREGITLDVVRECGGVSKNAPGSSSGPLHDPRACKLPHCGQIRARRGNECAYGRTPLLALQNLPVLT